MDTDFERLKKICIDGISDASSLQLKEFIGKITSGYYDEFLKNRFRLSILPAMDLLRSDDLLKYVRKFVESDERGVILLCWPPAGQVWRPF